MSTTRDFDIVLLGATGYTGFLAAEHITRIFPTTLKWAIAGRSTASLEKLLECLRTINTDRLPPVIKTIELNAIDLDTLTSKTKVVINTIGPFCRFSTPIVESCAKNGTHYVDTTTETLWIKEMIDKYHSTAIQTGAKIIHSISLSSSPSDLLAWLSATKLKELGNTSAIQMTTSANLQLSGMSSGSLSSVLDVREKYGNSWFFSQNTNILTPNSHPSTQFTSLLSQLLGYKYNPDLGILTTSFTASGNISIVNQFIPAPSIFGAILIHLLTQIFNFLLSLSVFRWGIRKLAPKSGSGPDLVKSRETESVEFKSIAEADGVRVGGKWAWKGSAYEVSALMAAEAAGVLVGMRRGEEGGGIGTPTLLGMEFVERLRGAGVVVEVEVL